VSKKKDSKALFEVLGGQGKSKMGVPGWFGQPGPGEPARPEAPAPQPPPVPDGPVPSAVAEPPRTEAPVAPRRAPRAVAQARPAPAGRTTEPGDPMLSISGGRVRISLNQISAVVVAATLILLLFGAYQLGRSSAAPDDPGDGQTVKAPHKPDVLNPDGRPPGVVPVPRPPVTTPPDEFSGMVPNDAKRKTGCSYWVIQGSVQTYDDAMAIKKFLYKQGVDATIHRMPAGPKFLVLDMTGFASKNHPDADKRRTLLDNLGSRYKVLSQGRYSFKQKPGDRWMLTER